LVPGKQRSEDEKRQEHVEYNIDWVDNSTVPKNKKGLGHISSCYPFSICCPSFFLAHAQFPRAKTLAADKFTDKSEFLNAAVFKLPHNSSWMRS